MSPLSIGFDIGGSNLRAGLFQGANPTPISVHSEAVGDARRPKELCQRIARICEQLLAPHKGIPCPVGIAFAGMLRGEDGFVVNSPHYGWHDVAFGAQLREVNLGKNYSYVVNDVNAAAYAEWLVGGRESCDDLLAVFIGTGIGAGIVCGGKLLIGSSNTAAELGHIKVVLGPEARRCACGQRGCLEAYAGGKAIEIRVREELRTAKSLATALAGKYTKLHPGHIDSAAQQGDSYALKLLSELSPMLGLALANAITLLNPRTLVLGGGVLSNTPFFKTQICQAIRAYTNPPAYARLQIIDATLGDWAGAFGAAQLAVQQSRISPR